MELLSRVRAAFQTYCNGKPAAVVRAPGRVNLIGEHTDYNEGFVLPMAIERAVWIALRPRADRRVRLLSLDFGGEAVFSLDALRRGAGWEAYIQGVAHALQQAGYRLRGWEGVIAGDVPPGAGLSSSAAVEMAAARAFALASEVEWEAPRMALLCQKAENEWVGVRSGIMDQMASALCLAGHALFLDCRSLSYRHVPLPQGVAVVILDTSTRRGLLDSAYNERRAQCEQAARFFGVPALRDVSPSEFEEKKHRLDEVVRKRARHVIAENQRVLEAVSAMQEGDAGRLGRLFDASHISLRDDFEVTNPALDDIVEAARSHPSCYGARMTGAGFGGCAVALVREGGVEAFVQAVHAAYRLKSGLEAKLYITRAAAGVSVEASNYLPSCNE